MALTDETAEREGQPPKSVWKHVFRARTILYTVLWAGSASALIVALFLRTEIDVNVTPVRNPTFVTLSDGTIRNTYDLRLRNKHGEDRWFYISATSGARLDVSVEGADDLRVLVPANETLQTRVYITAAPDSVAASADRTDVTLWIEDKGSETQPGTDRVAKETIFNGKGG
jgi:polyferredoxin